MRRELYTNGHGDTFFHGNADSRCPPNCHAERSTLFLNDDKTQELWSEVGDGIETTQIRFPNHLGIAGTVFTSGKTKPVRIMEVLDYHTKTSFPNLMEVVSYFKEGRHYYRQGDFSRAIKLFGNALKLHPADRLSQTFNM